MKKIILLLLGMLAFSGVAFAVPQAISYSGRLVWANGSVVNQTVDITIRVYDDPTAGNLLIEENHSLYVKNGLLSFYIGNTSVLDFNANYYIEANISGETLSPRYRVSSAPYAFRANNSDRLATQNSYFYVNTTDNRFNGVIIPWANVTSTPVVLMTGVTLPWSNLTGYPGVTVPWLNITGYPGVTVPWANITNAPYILPGVTIPTANVTGLLDYLAFLNLLKVNSSDARFNGVTLPIGNVTGITGVTLPIANITGITGVTIPKANVTDAWGATIPTANVTGLLDLYAQLNLLKANTSAIPTGFGVTLPAGNVTSGTFAGTDNYTFKGNLTANNITAISQICLGNLCRNDFPQSMIGVTIPTANVTGLLDLYAHLNLLKANSSVLLELYAQLNALKVNSSDARFNGVTLPISNVTGITGTTLPIGNITGITGVTIPKSNVTDAWGVTIPISNVTNLDSSKICSGTDKVTNVTITSTGLSIVCSADETGGTASNGITIPTGNVTGLLDIYAQLDLLKTNTSDFLTYRNGITGLSTTNVTGLLDLYAQLNLNKANVSAGGATIPIANVTNLDSSTVCSGTDKVTNVTITSSGLSIVCSADEQGTGANNGVTIPKANVTDAWGATIPTANVTGLLDLYAHLNTKTNSSDFLAYRNGISGLSTSNMTGLLDYFAFLNLLKANTSAIPTGFGVTIPKSNVTDAWGATIPTANVTGLLALYAQLNLLKANISSVPTGFGVTLPAANVTGLTTTHGYVATHSIPAANITAGAFGGTANYSFAANVSMGNLTINGDCMSVKNSSTITMKVCKYSNGMVNDTGIIVYGVNTTVTPIYSMASAFDINSTLILGFNETSGNPVDGSGNGNNGAFTGTHYAQGYPTSVLNKAIQFQGNTDTDVHVADATSLKGTTFTIEAWVNFTAVPAAGDAVIFVMKDDAGNKGWWLGYVAGGGGNVWCGGASADAGNIVFGLENSRVCTNAYVGIPETNRWLYIVGTFDGTNAKIYLNGTLMNTSAAAMTPDTSIVRIGADVPNARWAFNGAITEVVFSNYLARDQTYVTNVWTNKEYLSNTLVSTDVNTTLRSILTVNGAGKLTLPRLASAGNGYLCIDATGTIYKSSSACV